MMVKPVRLQLSRRKGFDLQKVSKSVNGLDAVNCARPGKWGNPFLVHPKQSGGREWGAGTFSVPTVEDAVSCFREMMSLPGERADAMRAALPELRGRNLACWCKPGTPCHADVLLEIANSTDTPTEGE